MRFYVDKVQVAAPTVLQDDTVRDVALKLTHGAGGVYLYACRTTNETNAVSVWQKYKRPLTCSEMTAELRNVGARIKLDALNTYEFEDVSELFPSKCQWEYVPLGQHLTRGVRVKPPKNGYQLDEYVNAKGTMEPEKRLYDYVGVTDVFAVTVRHLYQVYLPHTSGMVPDDTVLHGAVSRWQWNQLPVYRWSPKVPTRVDLAALFQRVHANPHVPCIQYGKRVRVYMRQRLKEMKTKKGLTFYFVLGESVTFYADGSVQTAYVENLAKVQPIVHYVNQVLSWKTAMESDALLMGTCVEVPSTLLNRSVFPLCQGTDARSVTMTADCSAVLDTVPLPWSNVFQGGSYLRCTPHAELSTDGKQVTLLNLPYKAATFATRYAEGMLTHVAAEEECILKEEFDFVIPKEPVTEFDTFVNAFLREGYDVGERFVGGVVARDPSGVLGFLPFQGVAENAGVLSSWIKPWKPTLTYSEMKAYLQRAAIIRTDVAPVERVYNFKADCVGIGVASRAFAPCHGDADDELKVTTEHERQFPEAERMYGVFRDACRTMGIQSYKDPLEGLVVFVDHFKSNLPEWIDGKWLVPRVVYEEYAERLQTELKRFHRVRSYVLRLEQSVDGVVHDLLEDETIE
jgi:hypothetical protein